MLIHKTGDIFTTNTNVIGHGVNCHGIMGSGIAVTVRTTFPDVYEAYRHQCEHDNDEARLSGGDMFPYQSENGVWVLNLASQEKPGRNAQYDFLTESALKAFQWCEENFISAFSLPRIGSGVGGLNEEAVEEILQRAADENPSVDLELWTYKQ